MKYSIIFKTRHQLILLRAKMQLEPIPNWKEIKEVDDLIKYYSDYIEAYDQKKEVQ